MNEPPPHSWWQYVALLFLLFFSMFFSSGETAFISCNLLKIKYFSIKLKRARRVLKLLKDKNTFLISSLIGNSIVNIVIGTLITAITVQYCHSASSSLKAAIISTFLLLIFGEIIPKSISLSFPESIAMLYSLPESILIHLLYPVSIVFLKFSIFLLKIFKVDINEKNLLVSEEDLKLFLEHSSSSGLLTKDEEEIMRKILKYDDVLIKNVMTPRTKIVSLCVDSSIEDVLETSKKTSLSRFPIYKEDIDEIKGVLYIKDFLSSSEYLSFLDSQDKEEAGNIKIERFLKKPCFIFANMHLRRARQILKENGQNMGIVIDEYGGTLGLITLEDLNEEIFGDIVDEYDGEEQKKDLLLKSDEKELLVAGDVPLDVINESLSLSLHSKQAQSIAGLIMEKLQDLPKEGSFIEEDGMRFIVKKIKGNKIEKVLIEENK